MNSSNKYAILHISDLHVEEFKSQGKNNEYNSRMCNQYYPDVLIKTLKNLKKTSKIEVKFIIISGDVANQSLPKEYKKVNEFLEKLMEELEIEKNQILIVPGNHDISRTHLRDQYEELVVDNGELKPYTLQKEKLSKYEKFYGDFFKKDGLTFEATKAICCERYLKDLNLLVLGINSVYRESFLDTDHKGEINNEALRKELKEIDREYPNSFKVAVFHHSPKVAWGHTEGIIQNWPVVRETFIEHNINVFFYGHTHECIRERKEIQDYIGCGSFAIIYKDFMNYFNLYVLDSNDDEKLEFDLQTYKFQPSTTDEGYYGLGKWELDGSRSGKFEIIKENTLNEIEDIPMSSQSGIFGEQDEIIDNMIEKQSVEILRNSDEILKEYSSKLLKIVSYKKMFKSGHFHWGENSKAHGWLDTNSLLSDCECAELSISALLHLINLNSYEADLVIGIGMEGNILAPSIAITLGAKYTYIPVTTRESSDFEKKIKVDECKKVLMITDTIFTGQTVYRILNRYEDEFKNFEKISLVSIFYTGTILSELSKRVNYGYIVDGIKIGLCNNNHENCPIYKNKLDIIYEL